MKNMILADTGFFIALGIAIAVGRITQTHLNLMFVKSVIFCALRCANIPYNYFKTVAKIKFKADKKVAITKTFPDKVNC